MEVRELLSSYEFPGDDTPIITGSALKAFEGDDSDIGVPSIIKLIDAMDDYIPEPEHISELQSLGNENEYKNMAKVNFYYLKSP